MSLLTNLVTQIASNAIQNKMGGQMPQQGGMGGQMPQQGGMGGLGEMFGGNAAQANNGFGLDDVLGSVLGGGMGRSPNMGGMGGLGGISQGGILGQVLGSVLGGGIGGGFGNSMGMGNSMPRQSGFGGKGMLMAALLPLALMFIQRNGGLSGALNKIQNMGFGQQANSWMSVDQDNQNLDSDAVSQLFDNDELQQVADQTGFDQHEVKQGMAELLPQVFDNLTPHGDTATDNEANQEISDLLNQLNVARR